MRARSVLIALAALGLTAAAPAPSPLDSLSECRVPRDQVGPTLAAIPVQEVMPSDEGGDVTYYRIPPDLRAFGYAPTMLAMSISQKPGSEHMQVLTVLEQPFAEVERRMLAAHGAKACEERSEGDKPVCALMIDHGRGSAALMVLQQFDDGVVGINCAYAAPED